MASVSISASFANGTRLDQIGKILQERMKWLGETARDSVAACALTVLKAIRTVTRVAKATGIKVQVKADNSLYPSYTTRGSQKTLCIRYRGSNERYAGKERVVPAMAPAKQKIQHWLVYRFTDTSSSKMNSYLIISPNASAAKAKAKNIVWSRAKRFAGLARRAIGVLMMKTATTKVNDQVARRVDQKARQVTSTREIVAKSTDGDGGKYSLVMQDDLRYALDAIKGGRATVDTQLKKAMNKMVSVINRKMPDSSSFFGKKKLPTPFPEIVRKRK